MYLNGMHRLAEDRLAENLSAAAILKVLNTQQCFDFDYIPSEGDNLVIHNPPRYIEGFISFIYKNAQWVPGDYNSFRDQLEVFHYGKFNRDS